jgi:hypothetical protein
MGKPPARACTALHNKRFALDGRFTPRFMMPHGPEDAKNAAKPPSKYGRGYRCFFIDHVLQADLGCDLDFLTGARGSEVDRESP